MSLGYHTPRGYSPNLPPDLLLLAITPLRLIFWGSLLLIFNISFTQSANGQGIQCDILDDTLGMILISIGIFRLAIFPVESPYNSIMTFLKFVCLLNILVTLDAHFIYPHPKFLSALGVLFSLVKLVATILFCTAMIHLSLEAAFDDVAKSWWTTRLLFTVIYLLPLGLLYSTSLVALGTGHPFKFDIGPAALCFLVIFIIPPVHLFISTSRLKRAILDSEFSAWRRSLSPRAHPALEEEPPPQL